MTHPIKDGSDSIGSILLHWHQAFYHPSAPHHQTGRPLAIATSCAINSWHFRLNALSQCHGCKTTGQGSQVSHLLVLAQLPPGVCLLDVTW